MTTPAINRSLTTIRTELEFLKDSEVLTDDLYDRLCTALPPKYQANMPPWGIDKLEAPSADKLAVDLANTSIVEKKRAPSPPPPLRTPHGPAPQGYCIAQYDYESNEQGDLRLRKGDKICVYEHLSPDWWKGAVKNLLGSPGVFPSNYVKVVSQQEYDSDSDTKAVIRPGPNPHDEKQHSLPLPYDQKNQYDGPPPAGANYGNSYGAPQNYNSYPPQQQAPQQYGSYAQYPPPSTNFYAPPPPAQQQYAPPAQIEQPSKPQSLMAKIGGKFGNAAIFGAGATVGSDIVNAIF